ncbi:MAG: hypothetical protein H6551_11260 [Chitinophagales bacterium]|nr:hypothetical protein [Chitinophagaceae bacterium]MCB9065704.1 hypothetical protein [Chitinophagales bacterium]
MKSSNIYIPLLLFVFVSVLFSCKKDARTPMVEVTREHPLNNLYGTRLMEGYKIGWGGSSQKVDSTWFDSLYITITPVDGNRISVKSVGYPYGTVMVYVPDEENKHQEALYFEHQERYTGENLWYDFIHDKVKYGWHFSTSAYTNVYITYTVIWDKE